MPERKNETQVNIRFNGHPPACTCNACVERRAAKPVSETFDEEERDWIAILDECPYCHQKAQIWNKKEKKMGCMNRHCRKYYEYL